MFLKGPLGATTEVLSYEKKKKLSMGGGIDLEHPFILAPMAGITNSPFRVLMRRLGSACMVSELISANGLKHASVKTREMLTFKEEERPVGIQIFGESLENLVEACIEVEKTGADFVDLNLGCPVPKVVKRGAGSAMCKDPANLYRVLKAMVESVRIPVTIKIRTGWDSETVNAHEIVKVASDAGVCWVAIHGRTRAQGYSGIADWDLIGEIKARSPLPIIGNGDLTTPKKANEMLKHSGVDAVMIGRGALRNPFIFYQSKELWLGNEVLRPTSTDYLNLLKELKNVVSTVWESERTMIYARKFISWYVTGFKNCHEFRGKVFKIKDPDELWNEVSLFFESQDEDRDFSFLEQPFLMGGHG